MGESEYKAVDFTGTDSAREQVLVNVMPGFFISGSEYPPDPARLSKIDFPAMAACWQAKTNLTPLKISLSHFEIVSKSLLLEYNTLFEESGFGQFLIEMFLANFERKKVLEIIMNLTAIRAKEYTSVLLSNGLLDYLTGNFEDVSADETDQILCILANLAFFYQAARNQLLATFDFQRIKSALENEMCRPRSVIYYFRNLLRFKIEHTDIQELFPPVVQYMTVAFHETEPERVIELFNWALYHSHICKLISEQSFRDPRDDWRRIIMCDMLENAQNERLLKPVLDLCHRMIKKGYFFDEVSEKCPRILKLLSAHPQRTDVAALAAKIVKWFFKYEPTVIEPSEYDNIARRLTTRIIEAHIHDKPALFSCMVVAFPWFPPETVANILQSDLIDVLKDLLNSSAGTQFTYRILSFLDSLVREHAFDEYGAEARQRILEDDGEALLEELVESWDEDLAERGMALLELLRD